jgi:hypothetical protein
VAESLEDVLFIEKAVFASELLLLLLFLLELFLLEASEKRTVKLITSVHHFPEDGALMDVYFFFTEFVLDLSCDIHENVHNVGLSVRSRVEK